MQKRATLLAVLLLSGTMFAGNVVLTGTDVISLHGGHPTYDAALFNDMAAGGGGKPILVLNNFGGGGSGYSGYAGGFVFVGSLSGITLSNYAALFMASPGRCCGDPSSLLAPGDAAAIHSYIAGGGGLGVENFLGASFCGPGPTSDWITILGFDPVPGRIGAGCNDATDLVNVFASPLGLSKGYPATDSEGFWNHQVYDPTFWTAHNYNVLLYAGTGVTNQWQAMELNSVPEPSSLLLLGTAVVGLAGTLRRKFLS